MRVFTAIFYRSDFSFGRSVVDSVIFEIVAGPGALVAAKECLVHEAPLLLFEVECAEESVVELGGVLSRPGNGSFDGHFFDFEWHRDARLFAEVAALLGVDHVARGFVLHGRRHEVLHLQVRVDVGHLLVVVDLRDARLVQIRVELHDVVLLDPPEGVLLLLVRLHHLQHRDVETLNVTHTTIPNS